ncbi:DNA polymerase II large subunit, partial [Candidatus Micrarchaeota archaeon]|nr:DNA polymerase II large subunit [Candidatus Micrarchaeota archaeon]
LQTIFKIFEDVIEGRLGDIPNRQKRLEQAVKTALVLVTEGVVVAPLDGVPSVKISKNFDGTEFVDVYFAGPIRAAGGTHAVFPLILGDYGRKLLGLDRYKPTEEEVERYVEELQIYDEIFTRQYKMNDDEARKIIRGCPVCINGEPTEEREVTAHKDLERVSTNRVRGGACLVIAEGIALKARKILGYTQKVRLDWSWLEQIIKVNKGGDSEQKVEPSTKYLTRIAAGRPILAYPSNPYGFRLRYGRCRNTGIMAKGMHPATMKLLDDFIAVGTQTKVERPGKSAEMFPCDTIEGPIVKLKNGEVRYLGTGQEAEDVLTQVKEILFLGDCLVTYGDFRKSAHPLMPVGYCEEWWAGELKRIIGRGKIKTEVDLDWAVNNPREVDGFTAVELSMQLGIALHPRYLAYYVNLGRDEAVELIGAVRAAEKGFEGNKIVSARMKHSERVKELLEKIGVQHIVEGDEIVIEKGAYPFLKTMGALSNEEVPEGEQGVLKILSTISGIEIRDKGGSFIGMRMGRPETARPRKMAGNPNILFPVGLEGGPTRLVRKAIENRGGKIEADIGIFKCTKCGKDGEYASCTACGERAVKVGKCGRCGKLSEGEKCENCNYEIKQFGRREVDIGALMERAMRNLKVNDSGNVKGVRGLISKNKIIEPLEKGILRAKYGLHIFRDATIRFEMLNAPLTHFKPREIGITAEKARELGYEKDVDGREIVSDEQLLELFAQDVVINKGGGEFFVKVTQFVDELLSKFYGMEPQYNISNTDELIGELVLGLAPHTSAAVVGRIIGYTDARLCFAHPYFHLTKRRNADGDQDSVMLLLDVLLNFSQHYLPETRGGRMDAPLVFTVAINPTEVDDEVYEVETCSEYPLELYEKCRDFASADSIKVPRVGDKLGKMGQYTGIGFTHSTETFDEGPKISKYVLLETMEDKINGQAKLQGKIRAVEKKDALERVMVSHFLPDIIGNARAFSRQTFRCTTCNTKYRRIPLSGKCGKCKKGH